MAHNVGQRDSDRSPRGRSDLPIDERDTADNIVLLCGGCHTEVDNLKQVDLFPVEKIDAIKSRHESRIFSATASVGAKNTAILRLSAPIRDVPVEIAPDVAASAVLATSDRFPNLPFAHDRQGVDIDLRSIPYEDAPTNTYYKACADRVDQLLDRLVRP
ncbi:MAG: hypothetical protein OXH63_26565, partial [Gemmatimonadetes bacterium]|nr:hypothetical protein [Gemmatimonadota bacterium]